MSSTASAPAVTRLEVPEMCCASEAQVIGNCLRALPGVSDLDFDLLARRVTVTHSQGGAADLRAAVAATGFRAELLPEGAGLGPMARPAAPLADARRRRYAALAGSGLLALAAEALAWGLGEERSLLVLALALGSIALGGRTAARKGLGALRTRTLNINLLMLIAVTGAVLIGHWPEAAMVMFLFALAEELESRALDRARDAIRGLMTLAPDTALVRDEAGGWARRPSAEVGLGEVVRVLPGERLPLDGAVVAGSSTVDQAPITGESLPVEKGPGDPVFAGTINTYGPLELRVTALAGDTTLDHIARTIQAAQARRAPTERFVDRFARYYTPAVVLLAALVAVLPPLAFGVPLYDAVYRALVLLVVACPCALVLSTPVTVVSGLTAGARRGILVKGGAYLELGRQLRVIALDKTGTLTHGRPTVTDVLPLDGVAPEEILRVAASLNAHASHPVARATVDAWTARAGDEGLLPASEVRALPGRGVTGNLGGQPYFVGSHRLAEELAVCSPAVEAELLWLERAGKTTVVVGSRQRPLGVLAVADSPRPGARAAVAALAERGVRVVMLTGDNEATARAVAAELGIGALRAGLLPEDKLAAIEALAAEQGPVGMVGDGVNDAPALAAASIGFAMGAAGTDTALETADVALMDDELGKLAEFLDLSRRTTRVLAANIALAIGLKAAVLLLALAGEATLWMAVFADMGTSLLVVANGLRLLRFGGSRAKQAA